MKLEQLIVQYFYQNRSLTLQDVGTFSISPDIVIPMDTEKEVSIPANSIHFQYDKKAGLDEGLIQYIMQHSRKIRPLAESDLDSFVNLNKQVLNIGRPLVLEGMGTLQKNQAGSFDFTQQNAYASKKTETPVVIKEKVNRDISFSQPKEKSSVNSKAILVTLISILALAALAAAAYYFYNQNKQVGTNNVVETKDTTAANQSIDTTTLVTDTSALATPDSLKTSLNTSPYSFRLFINKYPSRAVAESKLAKLQSYGHKTMVIEEQDSVNFRIVMPFTNPLTDTAKVKDSIKKIFPKTFIIQ